MALILSLETSTKVCSVALAENGNLISIKELFDEKYSHAEKLNLFIEDVLQQANKKFSDLDAVAVSEGPGSYTGLRIGTSSAKGLCYALDKPLIAINSLKSLANLVTEKTDVIIPLFDAMRMEVYAAAFDSNLNELEKTSAKIIESNSFENFLSTKKTIFVGPGAAKCVGVINSSNATFDLNLQVSSRGMISLAEQKFNQNQFVDTAYFEPFYLKDFIVGGK